MRAMGGRPRPAGRSGRCGQGPGGPVARHRVTRVTTGSCGSPARSESARLFAGKLRRTSANPVVYAELPGAQHTFDLFRSVRFEKVIDAIEVFAAWVRSREGQET